MLNDIDFLRRYSYLFESDILKLILEKEQYWLLKINYLLIKNDFNFSEDYDENKSAKIVVITYLTCKYKIFDKEFSYAAIDTFFRMIDTKVKELLRLYGKGGLSNLQKLILENNIEIDKLNDDIAVFLATKYNIGLDGILAKTVQKVKVQITRYGNILPYLNIDYSELSKKTKNCSYDNNIKTVADICDLYNGYTSYFISKDVETELYKYLFNHRYDKIQIISSSKNDMPDLDEEKLNDDIIDMIEKINKFKENKKR